MNKHGIRAGDFFLWGVYKSRPGKTSEAARVLAKMFDFGPD